MFCSKPFTLPPSTCSLKVAALSSRAPALLFVNELPRLFGDRNIPVWYRNRITLQPPRLASAAAWQAVTSDLSPVIVKFNAKGAWPLLNLLVWCAWKTTAFSWIGSITSLPKVAPHPILGYQIPTGITSLPWYVALDIQEVDWPPSSVQTSSGSRNNVDFPPYWSDRSWSCTNAGGAETVQLPHFVSAVERIYRCLPSCTASCYCLKTSPGSR